MLRPARSLTRKYRVYLGSSFSSAGSLRQVLLRQLARAGLFTYVMETTPAALSFEHTLQKEIESSDMFVLVVHDLLGAPRLKGEPLVAYEFRCAQEGGKPILAYLSDNGAYGSFSGRAASFKSEVVQFVKYHRLPSNEQETAAEILGDILELINAMPELSCWVRSDISRAEVEKIAAQKDALDQNLLQADMLIERCENRLDPVERNRLVGPLVDLGLRVRLGGRAYRYAVARPPQGELSRDDLQFEYFINRFERYDSSIIYDRKLDLYWLPVPRQNFDWNQAIAWQQHIDVGTRRQLENTCPGGKLDNWRLPTIEELITLLAFSRGADAHMDETVFPRGLHWFWSSTLSEDKTKAYYLELAKCSVLEDTFDHHKGLLLCTEQQPLKLGRSLPDVMLPSLGNETRSLRQANQSQRIYGVYLSVLGRRLDEETLTGIRHALDNAGYYLTIYHALGARPGAQHEIILREMQHNDYYLLIINDSVLDEADTSDLERVRQELQIARDSGLLIWLFHNLDENALESIRQKLPLLLDLSTIPGFRDARHLSTDILAALARQQETSPRPGWVQKRDFDTINSNIESINSTITCLEASDEAVNAFIDHCDGDTLRQAFIRYGVITPKPQLGTQTRFVSQETPIERLALPADDADRSRLPVLFAKIPDRFRLLDDKPDHTVVLDTYLDLKWLTTVRKHISYEQALAYAREISECTGGVWRLPSASELITLLTSTRGERKYMDEDVFPTGRWFWSSTRLGNTVLYVDFNFMRGSVSSESISEQLPFFRLKTAMLVSRGDEHSAALDEQGVQPGMKVNHVPGISQEDRQALIDVLIRLPGLSGERSRQSILYAAGLEPLRPQIDLSGSPAVAVPMLLRCLEDFGIVSGYGPALGLFLKALLNQTGEENQLVIQSFIQKYQL